MDLNTAIDVIESVAGFTDADTSVGEAWAVVMAQLNAAPAPAGEVMEVAHVRRMCDIILDNTFGNEELDSLALFVGHHPDVLNASPASATGVSLEELSQVLRDEWTLVSCEQTAQFLLDHPRIGPLLAQSIPFPAPAPAGEVAKLVQPPGRAGLTWQGVIEGLRDVPNDESEDAIQRVWQRSRILDAILVMEANPCPAPVPVAVAERPWESEGWCDSEGRCWIHCPGQSWDTWVLTVPQNAIDGAHCLPATALPKPSGEVAK